MNRDLRSQIPVAIWRKSPNQFNPKLLCLDLLQDEDIQKSILDGTRSRQKTSRIPVPTHKGGNYSGHKSLNSGANSFGTSSEGSSPNSSNSMDTSPNTISLSLTPLLLIVQLTQSLPSVKAKTMKYRAGQRLNWLNPFTPVGFKPEEIGTGDHLQRVKEVADVIAQISLYFNPKKDSSQDSQLKGNDPTTDPNSKTDLTESQYFGGILANEMNKDKKCQAMFKNPSASVVNVVLREEIVRWMISAASKFHYSIETVFIAVYLMDAFVHNRKVREKCWTLLGLAAFQLAAKWEETHRAKLPEILKKFKSLSRMETYLVVWMEGEILRVTKFLICPPTPKLLVDLAVNSGEIRFPTLALKRHILKLSHDVLLVSLEDSGLTPIRSVRKAELALQCATEFVLYYRKSYSRSNKLLLVEADIFRNAVNVCYALFRALIAQDRKTR